MSSMPHANPRMQPDPDTEHVVLGVDTHKDVHVAAVVSIVGAQVADAMFPTAAGYWRLLAWARGFGCYTAPGWKAPAPTARP